MTTRKRMLVTIICAFALLANVVGVFAQEKVTKTEPKFVTVDVPAGMVATTGVVQGDNTFVFVSSEMSIDGKVVKGAPYSAQAVSESVQTLPGGNRIVRQNTSTIYRDSEGRTRREQTISVVGGFSAAGQPAQTTFINDPVAGVNYILDSTNRTARKIDYSAKMSAERKMVEGMRARTEGMRAKTIEGSTSQGERITTEKINIERAAADGEVRFEMRTAAPLGAPGGGAVMMARVDSKNTRKESLGKQTMEGVEVEGSRSITTIPAGEIGNEQPIEIVSERWFSPELQTVVMTRHSDPRMGETTYRLTNINRSEPARSLFEVPADFTIQERETIAPMRYKIESEVRKPGAEKKEQ